MIDFQMLWDKYGWLGFLAYVFVTQIWPFLRDRYFPAHLKTKMKEQQVRWEEKELEMKEHLDDKIYERKLEERSVIANERFASAMESTQRLMVASNEKMNRLLELHLEHDRFTKDALLQMSLKTAEARAEYALIGRRKTDIPPASKSE